MKHQLFLSPLMVGLLISMPVMVGHHDELEAQPTNDEASLAQSRMHFTTGQTLVTAGKFALAYAEFEAGYALSGRPLFLFNMAECAKQLDSIAKARADYDAYLLAEPDGQMASLARKRLKELGAGVNPVGPKLSLEVKDPAETMIVKRSDLILSPKASSPLWRRWPFWAVLGGAAVAGVVIVYVAREDNEGVVWDLTKGQD